MTFAQGNNYRINSISNDRFVLTFMIVYEYNLFPICSDGEIIISVNDLRINL